MPATDLLIPVRRCRRTKGTFRFPDRPVLASHRSGDLLPLEQLAGDLRRDLKLRPRIDRNAFGECDLRIRRVDELHGPEGYRIAIRPAGIEVLAESDAGAYYAIQTLRDMVSVAGRKLECCTIDDSPDFARRGIYHDCARGKVPEIETLKALVERLARWKINELQLYVENAFTWARHPKIGRRWSPFKPGELLELQDHCKKHHVRLVGSLASFGHMEKILNLPEYAHLSEQRAPHTWPGEMHTWQNGTTLCATDPKVAKFMNELYEEYLPLFEPADFNACCDETWELGKGRSRTRAEKVGVGRVYMEFLIKLNELCGKYGKRMNVWGDIVLQHPELLGELPRDLVLLNWEYAANGARIPRTKDIAAAGLPLVVCPGTSCWMSHGTRLPNAMTNIRQFAAEGRKNDAEGLLNTNWGDRGHRNPLGVSLHAFAYGGAQSWCGTKVDDEKFTERFCRHSFGITGSKMPDAIRALGSSYQKHGPASDYGGGLYLMLMEPLVGDVKGWGDGIAQAQPDGLREIIEVLGDPGIWPELPRGLDRFDRLTMREYVLASRMDALAARRALAGKALRAGQTVRTADFRKLARDLHGLGKDFESLWRQRNKPSRLRDNMRCFDRVEREARRLAKKGR